MDKGLAVRAMFETCIFESGEISFFQVSCSRSLGIRKFGTKYADGLGIRSCDKDDDDDIHTNVKLVRAENVGILN